MEHVTITELGNEFKKVVPEEGYLLKQGENTYSEAVVKNLRGWSVVEIPKDDSDE